MNKEYIAQALQETGFKVAASKELPGRHARLRAVPDTLHETLRTQLSIQYLNGLYEHQAAALEAVALGQDVCLATSTASGKSLVFMAGAVNILCEQPSARILALYPARALLQDQYEKWTTFASPFGIQVGRIDGGIPTDQRTTILRDSKIILMTPDVLHSWVMTHLRDPEVSRFLRRLELLVLDEAHVYDGVFGTNMAYLIRRFDAVTKSHRLICCTATLHEPAAFVKKLTARKAVCFGMEADASPAPPKSLLLAETEGKDDFESTVLLLKTLSRSYNGRFIAFTDSRRAVEQFVAATHRGDDSYADSETGTIETDPVDDVNKDGEEIIKALRTAQVLPYRAGYEEEDRTRIQRALSAGTLTGVVSTSALELGLDIGAIDLAILIGLPASMKAFWQRVGRAGRRDKPGTCLIIDTRRALQSKPERLNEYLSRPVEPSWIYMDNRFIQYANVLCAAHEWQNLGIKPSMIDEAFVTLPEEFRSRLHNELNPQDSVPEDLYSLKKEAQTEPHRAFPLRDAGEKNFQISIASTMQERLGTASLSQALRESYPGAVYYYMAQPYRVKSWDFRKSEILCRYEKRYHTKPLSQAMVFPQFQGLYRLYSGSNGFLAETALQVTERVLGFMEQRGAAKTEHRYGAGSFYSQQPQVRHFQTTGVCWSFGDKKSDNELVALFIKEAYCLRFGVQERDLGVGFFHSKQRPQTKLEITQDSCTGVCVFDVTNGSLRLSERIADHLLLIIEEALLLAGDRENDIAIVGLLTLKGYMAGLSQIMDLDITQNNENLNETQDKWVVLVAPGEKATYFDSSTGNTKNVEILGYRYTPKGIMYDLVSPRPDITRWQVGVEKISPLNGVSRLIRYNLNTGDEETA